MTPLLGRPLTSFIFIDSSDEAAVKTLNKQLMQTEITQPAVLATDLALTRLFAAYGIAPDMVMGHSLGEYGALVAAHSLTLPSALEAVSARGREMTKVSMADNGAMAAVFGPLEEIERIVAEADGYVVVANINSFSQAVVGGGRLRGHLAIQKSMAVRHLCAYCTRLMLLIQQFNGKSRHLISSRSVLSLFVIGHSIESA